MNTTEVDTNKSFIWLTLDHDSDYVVYQKYWDEGIYKRPHDHPRFLELVRPKNYSPAAVVYQYAKDARVIYPFFLCELNSFAPFKSIGMPVRHIVSPYGYGGPLYEGKVELQEEASRNFEQVFSEELRKRHVVSEFVREDIFPARLARRTMGTVDQQPNVIVRLDRTEEEIWSNYKHAVRSNINRARKFDLRVEFDFEGERLDSFLHIYYETMERKDAASSYFFPKDRFKRLASTLRENNAMMFAHVFEKNDIVSSELLLLSGDTIYSFLGGSLSSAFSKRPNNLLKHEIILWGVTHGYHWLVLGGGRVPGDQLFRFKQSFDPHHIVPFSVRRIIHHQQYFDLMNKIRSEYERDKGNSWPPGSYYFPEFLHGLDRDESQESVSAQWIKFC